MVRAGRGSVDGLGNGPRSLAASSGCYKSWDCAASSYTLCAATVESIIHNFCG